MTVKINFSEQKSSWTKYDIVQVMEVIENLDTLEKYKNKEAVIDGPILKSFLGIKELDDPLPDYWIEIQNYPSEKKLFALFATIFTHGGIVNEFAMKYSKGDMTGIFTLEEGKQYTNIRSALIESGAASRIYRRKKEVPFDFSPIFQNPEVGKLFKQLLIERMSRLTADKFLNKDFYEACFNNNFHKALSLSKSKFRSWLEGDVDFESNFIRKVSISNFFSIENIELNFDDSKEIYFLGENGDGKSLILMAIYLAFNGSYITEKTDLEQTGKAADILRSNKKVVLSGIDDSGKEYNPKKSIYLNNLFGYGTHRGRYSTDKHEEYGFMSLFDSEQTLINPVSWLKDQKLFFLDKNTLKKTNFLSNEPLEKMFYELLERNLEITIEGSDVLFSEKGSILTFDQLSEGYRSTIIFVSDLIYRLNKNAKKGVKTTDLKGVVLVDEIDLHLHPKWQRVIVNKLRNLFPNIQFFFTTHSPTMIQGASDDAVIFRVYRNNEDGKTRISDPYFRKNLDHLMINTLLTSPLFGLKDSRMKSEDNNADTSDTYLIYKINKALEKKLEEQKKSGKKFITDADIDQLIQNILSNNQENDKDQ